MPSPVLPRIAAGDAGAVEECLDRYGGLVWSLARRYSATAADAEDATQEVFVAVWKNAGRFDESVASEATFITMICRRRLIDILRRKKAPESAGGDAVDEATAPSPPAPQIEINEEVARVRACMDQLSGEQRRVLDLAICEGLSQSTIAELTGWPLGTVKSHARRGMAKLKELVGVGSPDDRTQASERGTV
ncbi:MAG: sigma-70 family RNA polymerase sigma factor [Planctomycetota bacterium]